MGKQLSASEVREKQLELLDYIDAVCKANGLRYYLAFGTLLGAIRHKGFIPWDDDVDIWMPREDYIKFRTLVNEENRFFVDDVYTNETFRSHYSKLINPNVRIEENAVVPSRGLFIDIFYLDRLGDTEEQVRENLDSLIPLHKSFYLYNYTFSFVHEKGLRRIVKCGYMAMRKMLMACLNMRKRLKRHHERLIELDRQYTNYYGYCVSPFKRSYYILKREWFDAPAVADYEGRQYSIPAEYDSVLKCLYGDYMTPPPEDQRNNHCLIAYEETEA